MIYRQMTTGGLALVLGFCAMSMPTAATARGSASITITPKGESARVLQEGLHWYSIFQNTRNRARVDQKGTGNGAAVSQSGRNNWAGIFQRGKGHAATVTQNGNDNALGVVQFGKKTNMTASQSGNGNVGLVLQGGW